jgi:probable rRNA maturation factor
MRTPAVTLQVATSAAAVPGAASIRRWVSAARPGPAEITVRIVGAREGRSLNRAFRGKDCATNVLAFAYGRQRGALRGDLVLCAPLVAREARDQGKDLRAHYAHLTVHGVLHLRGYLHDDAKQAGMMERAERAILRRLGYPDPYQ